jgi:hypothetical protein
LLYRLLETLKETVKSVSVSIVEDAMGVNDKRSIDPLVKAGMFKLSPELDRVVAIKLVGLMLGSE